MQLWRSRVCCQNRGIYVARRLDTTLERTRFCSHSVGLCSTPTRRRWLLVRSACPPVNLATQLRFSLPLYFSFFLRCLVTKVRLRTLESIVFSVAEWLALLRYQWRCLHSVEVRSSNPRLQCHGQSRKICDWSLESGLMGIISPATEKKLYLASSDEFRVRKNSPNTPSRLNWELKGA